ncbi:MAG: hypothetical protein AB7V77_01570 [Candidatus Woesearchaeota archaeon]
MKAIEAHKKVFKVSLIISIIYWLFLIFIYFTHHHAVMCMTCPLSLVDCPNWPRWFSSPCDCCVYPSEFFLGMFIYILWIIIPPIMIYLFLLSFFRMINKIKVKK